MAGAPSEWEAYYARTSELPATDRTAPFLKYIPPHGRILDFGTGSGRWAAAFHRDRPDITIDVLDRHIEKALLPPTLHGERYGLSFEAFKPEHTYDGIWAFATLFFIDAVAFDVCLRTLVQSLKPSGCLYLSMVTECDAARAMGMYGMTEPTLRTALANLGLDIRAWKTSRDLPYSTQNICIPETYYILAQSRAN